MLPGAVSVKVSGPMVAGFIVVSLKVPATVALRATPVAPIPGLVRVTVRIPGAGGGGGGGGAVTGPAAVVKLHT